MLNALGETRSCDSPVCSPPFFCSSTCRLVWVGATDRVVMVTFQVHLRRPSVSPCTFPTPIYCRWVNVAKCNLGSGLHHRSNMGQSWALAYFTALSLQSIILLMLLCCFCIFCSQSSLPFGCCLVSICTFLH